jgi:Na+-transporting NADH:ubiquinone oxidoreductase subunit F
MKMNYHVEHHMFPMVPFYNLPKLHALIQAQCPPAPRGLVAAYREIIPALWRQRKDPDYCIRRQLPQQGEARLMPGEIPPVKTTYA